MTLGHGQRGTSAHEFHRVEEGHLGNERVGGADADLAAQTLDHVLRIDALCNTSHDPALWDGATDRM
ncbi:Uncharacterised protein [Mycobacteroides abscessus subsp. abscessus]|nr:Uncharacterised protein [Mycobacteroides abscessus subsp. abscessus]